MLCLMAHIGSRTISVSALEATYKGNREELKYIEWVAIHYGRLFFHWFCEIPR